METIRDGQDAAKHHWFTGGPEEVADGVFRVPMSVSVAELHAVNVYVLCGDDGVDLIDAGDAAAGDVEQLDLALRAVGRRGVDEVRRVLVTHIHPDHYSLAPRIRGRARAGVYLGDGEKENLESINRLLRGERGANIPEELDRVGGQELLPLLESRINRAPTEAELGAPDVWIRDGQQILTQDGRLTAISTPGHTQGHIVFQDAQRGAYFTGDHVLPHITPSIGLESAPVLASLSDYLDSLQKMLELPDGTMLPAHGSVQASTHARVRELLEHHEARLAATRAAVENAGSTPFEVARRLTWTRREKPFHELPAWHRFLACTETAAHLETLVDRRALRRGAARTGAHLYQLHDPSH